MRPEQPLGWIPTAPTVHYGRTTPMNDQGIPVTPIFPAAPVGSGSDDSMGGS